MILAPTQPGEMAAAHSRARASRPGSASSRPSNRPRNVEPVLSIGQTEFIHFRGRAFGVPPLPWRAGERLTDLHVRALEAMETLATNAKDRDAYRAYYDAIGQMPRLLWANCHPTGKIARLLKFLRLSRNPFRLASDGELLEFSDFFLARRMRSGVRRLPMAANPGRRTS